MAAPLPTTRPEDPRTTEEPLAAEMGGLAADEAAHAARGDQAAPGVPIACTLGGEEQRERGEEILRLFLDGRSEARRLPDGYALRFPGDDAWAARLLAFIAGERACCPFFTFALHFEPGQGPIWLHLRGPEGTTEFVAEMLARVEAHG